MNSLQGIRVLDLSSVLAGPWATQTLADLGADVIKVERPGSADQGVPKQEATCYWAASRNQRSVTCDITQPAGQALIRALVLHCDVFVENFEVGDLARHGLDPASLQGLNPRLVYCSITDFGQDGLHAGSNGGDFVIQGMYAAVAILTALRHAEKTGQGQHIDLALLDTQVAMLANLGAPCLVSGQVPQGAGRAHAGIVPCQVFEGAPAADGSKDHIILAVGNDAQYVRFCRVANIAELGMNPLFVKNSDRVRNRDKLVPILEVVMKLRPKADWLAALRAAQVPCSAINDLAEVFADPQVQAREMVAHWQHPHKSDLPMVASPIRLSATPVRTPSQGGLAPPLPGQHTDEVLRELLGYDDTRLAALKDAQVI